MKKVFGENSQTEKPLKTGSHGCLSSPENTKGFSACLRFLAGFSSLLLLAPFLCIYFATRELLIGMSGGGYDTVHMMQWGIWALVFELAGLAVNFIALLCSHVGAFHTEKNLKTAALRHLSEMPLG